MFGIVSHCAIWLCLVLYDIATGLITTAMWLCLVLYDIAACADDTTFIANSLERAEQFGHSGNRKWIACKY